MGRKTSHRGSGTRSGRQPQTLAKEQPRHPESAKASSREYRLTAAPKAKSKWLPSLIIGTCAAIGTAILLLTTNWGVGTTTDSTVYINVARNFLKGYGLSHPPGSPMTHYPPLYPMALSLSGLLGQDPLDGARWLQAFLFCATITLSGLIIFRGTRGSITALITGLLMLLTSHTMIHVYSCAWSESLFIPLSLAGFLLLGEYIQKTTPILFLSSSFMIGFAFLTRYVGISLVITGCLCILFMLRVNIYKRVLIAMGFGIMTVFPISLWILRNTIVAGTLTNRSLVYHPVASQHINDALSTLSKWLFMPPGWPLNVRSALLALFAIAVLTGYVSVLRHKTMIKEHMYTVFFPSVLVIFIFSYFISLGLSISFLDAHTLLLDRILSPVYIIGVIGIVCIAYHLWLFYNNKVVAISLLSISILFVIGQAFQSVPLINSLNYKGSGFSSKSWKSSPIIGFVKSLPDDIVIYANGPDAIDILTGKSSSMIPPKVDAGTRLNNENFASQFTDMIRQIEDGKAILVYCHGITWRWYLPTKEEIAGSLHVPLLYQGRDGFISGTLEREGRL